MLDTKKKLKKLKKQSSPDRAFKRALLTELNVEFVAVYPTSKGVGWRRVIVIPMTVILLFVSTGTGTYAYSSSSVTEGHVLYPVKTKIEKVEEKMHRNPEAQAKYYVRMMERRIAEGEVMVEKDKFKDEDLDIINRQMFLVIQKLPEQSDEETRRRLLERLDMYNERYQGLTVRYMGHEPPAGHRRMMVSNKMQQVRVRIYEANLNEEERTFLLLKFNQYPEAPRAMDMMNMETGINN